MDSPTPRPSSISPPIPYRQASYFNAHKQSSSSSGLSTPNPPIPTYAHQPHQTHQPPPPQAPSAPEVPKEDDGGWGEEVDPKAHIRRLKKFNDRMGPPKPVCPPLRACGAARADLVDAGIQRASYPE
jgi:hypothetical protein